jgi:hypothetical protein
MTIPATLPASFGTAIAYHSSYRLRARKLTHGNLVFPLELFTPAGLPSGGFSARNQAAPPIIKAIYGDNPGLLI